MIRNILNKDKKLLKCHERKNCPKDGDLQRVKRDLDRTRSFGLCLRVTLTYILRSFVLDLLLYFLMKTHLLHTKQSTRNTVSNESLGKTNERDTLSDDLFTGDVCIPQ